MENVMFALRSCVCHSYFSSMVTCLSRREDSPVFEIMSNVWWHNQRRLALRASLTSECSRAFSVPVQPRRRRYPGQQRGGAQSRLIRQHWHAEKRAFRVIHVQRLYLLVALWCCDYPDAALTVTFLCLSFSLPSFPLVIHYCSLCPSLTHSLSLSLSLFLYQLLLTCIIFVHLLVWRHSPVNTLLSSDVEIQKSRWRSSSPSLRAVFAIPLENDNEHDDGDAIVFPTLFFLLPHSRFLKRERNSTGRCNINAVAATLRAGKVLACRHSIYEYDKRFSATTVHRYRAIRRFSSIFSHSCRMQSFPLFFMRVLFVCIHMYISSIRNMNYILLTWHWISERSSLYTYPYIHTRFFLTK